MRKPICLIVPPSPFLLDERVFPSLGILKIAAVLESSGIPVEVLDLCGIQNYLEVVKEYAATTSCTIFGITATTPQFPQAANISHVLRETVPQGKLIIGGPHPTLVAAAWKEEKKRDLSGRGTAGMEQLYSLFDVVVAGDGEVAILEAIEPEAPKLIDADNPKSSLFLTNDMLDQVPFPSRHLIDLESYHYSIEGVRATSLIAQLGCPFGCGFCGGRDSPMLRRVRMRTTKNILEEIKLIHDAYGLKGFMFYDDELNVSRTMIELMNGIAALQTESSEEWRLRGFIKSQLFTDEQASAMYSAGFRWILVGFESGSPRILDNINKQATREQNTRCMDIARRHGLKVKALMSIGHPGESPETIQDTEDWLLEVAPDDLDISIITTYPGTPYFDYASAHPELEGIWTYVCPKTGDRLHQREVDYALVSDYYKGDPDGGYQAYVSTDHLTSEELVDAREKIERTVRAKLNIPFNVGAPGIQYEHSMGQLPPHILRSSKIISTAP
jgi:anaerobic magnesium-protoporphyrin IX monomethyl ester cyclase